jgi:SOS-response transcriptional repressor LexA
MTEAELRTLDAIRAHVARTRLVPTVRELMRTLGHASPQTAHTHINSLIEQGMLMRVPPSKRRTSRERGYRLGGQMALAQIFTTEELIAELERRGAMPGQREAA